MFSILNFLESLILTQSAQAGLLSQYKQVETTTTHWFTQPVQTGLLNQFKPVHSARINRLTQPVQTGLPS